MKKFIAYILFLLLHSCSEFKSEDEKVIHLADSYYGHYINTNPEYALIQGISSELIFQFNPNSLEDFKRNEFFEDSLYTELLAVDKTQIEDKVNTITYSILKEQLERTADLRICKTYLWNVSHRYGLHHRFLKLAEQQPLETHLQRNAALKRWATFPDYIQNELNNLKTGISEGYTMPKEVVRAVIVQINRILDYDLDDSPFVKPVLKTGDKIFIQDWKQLVEQKVLPALSLYRNFLSDTYYKEARTDISMLELPNGEECYNAYLRLNIGPNVSGAEIYELGQQLVSSNVSAIKALGSELYGTDQFPEIIQHLRNDSLNFFHSKNELMTCVDSVLLYSKEECTSYFANLPTKDILIDEYKPYENGAGEMDPATGNLQAYIRINTGYQLESTKTDCERLIFHEAYPGHHLQIGIEQAQIKMHPISKIISFESYTEGWAIYAEQLAEEMGLYSSEAATIERRSEIGRFMVIDAGIHLHGWTREQVVDYCAEIGLDRKVGLGMYYRSAVWPGQLVAYNYGGEEIKSLRKLAEEQLGDRFDIAEFHTKVLENGSVPLDILRDNIVEWIALDVNSQGD
ncbi:DUF885 domain-containing protein [Maribellus sediminis]|uniref:DUF885 domain-containing protein n=1 Tax=Maribellus sediminis TaxID=2696285 RepID=UPI00142F4CFC|nr:DUF885 domain-containing protein [Maribellus sediminis]